MSGPLRSALRVAGSLVLVLALALVEPTTGAANSAVTGQQGSVEDAYRLGQEQVASANYREAARTFRRLRSEHPDDARAEAATYWEAFALYRLGGRENLERAGALLEDLAGEGPMDAAALRSRIRIRLGDGISRLPPCDAGDGSWFGEAVLAPWTDATERAAVSALGDDRCPAVARRSAVLALGRRGGAGSFAALREAATADPDPRVRGEAIVWLEDDPSPDAVRVVASVIRDAEDTGLGQRAATVLPRLSAASSESAFYALLRNRRIPPSRRQVLLSQAALRGRFPVSVDSIRAAFGDMSGGSLQSTALEVVEGHGDREDREWIWSVAMSEDARPLTRVTAVQRVGSDRSVDELAALYRSAGSPLVRYGLIQELGGRSDADARRALRDIIASPRTASERAAAAAALPEGN